MARHGSKALQEAVSFDWESEGGTYDVIEVAEVVLVETDHGDVAETFVFVAFLWLES